MLWCDFLHVDFDEDNIISREDLKKMMDRLTGEDNTLSEDTKKVIIDKVITKLVHIKHLKVILIWKIVLHSPN